MKLLIASVLFVATAAQIIRNRSASSNAIDWSQIKHVNVELHAEVQDNQPKDPTQPDDSDRIVGGSIVKPHSLPYQAGLIVKTTKSDTYFWGGSLISPRTVLTLASCLVDSKSTLVILGAHEIKSDEDEQQKQKVYASDYKFHPEYNKLKREKNNVALLTLPDPVQYNEYVQPIELPVDISSDSFAGAQATVSGWGDTDDGQVSRSLQSVSVKVISNDDCLKTWPKYVFDGTLCYETKGGKSSCGRDYGGPVAINRNGRTIQIGVLSFTGSCKLGHPSGSERITEYLSWIQENTDE